MYYIVLFALLAVLPEVALAQTTGSLQGLIGGLGEFINRVIIPLILAIAFLSFLWNTVRFFIIGADNEESQQNAKTLAFYSVAAFVLFLSFWGIVRVIGDGIGLADNTDCATTQSDYYKVNRTAPCSSTRPAPRPHDAIDSTPPGGLPNPGTTDGLPPLPTGETIPTQPLPSGLPPGTDTSYYDYANVKANMDAAKVLAQPYFANGLATDFGANASAVKASLFADLSTTQTTGYTDVDRAVAIYRLQKLNAVPQDTLSKFLAESNRYAAGNGLSSSPLTTASIKAKADIPVSLPASVIHTMDETKATVIRTLSNFNPDNTPETLNAELFDQTLSPNTRYLNFRQYYTEGALYTQFVNDIKTEKIFDGDTSVLFE